MAASAAAGAGAAGGGDGVGAPSDLFWPHIRQDALWGGFRKVHAAQLHS